MRHGEEEMCILISLVRQLSVILMGTGFFGLEVELLRNVKGTFFPVGCSIAGVIP